MNIIVIVTGKFAKIAAFTLVSEFPHGNERSFTSQKC
jgi:hypothetical protein